MKKKIKENKTNSESTIQAKKKGDHSDSALPSKFIWAVFIVISLLLVATVVIIAVLCILQKGSLSTKVESTLLASGLSIIGIAISVWAGLNIIQVLEKGKFETLRKEVIKYSEERRTLNRNTLLKNIGQLDDEINKYLYKIIQTITDNDAQITDLYFLCNQIELKFQEYYRQHYTINTNVNVPDCEQTILKAKEILIRVENSQLESKGIFSAYLRLRLAELYYYLGYDIKKEYAPSKFEQAIHYYRAVFEDLHDPTLFLNNQHQIENIELTTYMLNTIGDAYSMMLLKYKGNGTSCTFEKNAEIANSYFEVLYDLLQYNGDELKIQKEIYYRNYACLLERANRFKKLFDDSQTAQKTKELYQKSMEISIREKKIPSNAFYAWLSFYKKSMNHLGLMERTVLQDRENLSNIIHEKKYTQMAKAYAEMAQTVYAQNIYFAKMVAFGERDLCAWNILEENYTVAKNHFTNMNDLLEKILIFNYHIPHDDFVDELLDSKKSLENILKDH